MIKRFAVAAVAAQLLLGVDAVPASAVNQGVELTPRDPLEYHMFGCYSSWLTWVSDPASWGLTVGTGGPDNNPATCGASCGTEYWIVWDQDCLCSGPLSVDNPYNWRVTGYIPTLDAWESTMGDCWRVCTDGTNCGGGARAAFYRAGPEPFYLPYPEPVSIPGYESRGCAKDSIHARVLPEVHDSDDMTPAKCAELCPYSKFIGLEYGRECWCGDELLANEYAWPCDMNCAGNLHQACGGSQKLSLYEYIGTPPTPPGPPEQAPIEGFEALGCYTDNVAGRTLPYVVANDEMTPEACAEIAVSGGYKFFGVEFGRECWAGNELNPASGPAESGCTMRCAGDEAQICGGPDRLNLYESVDEPSEPPPPTPLSCTRVASPDIDALACGIRGFAAPATAPTSSQPTLGDCAGICAATDGCASYAWDKTTSTCSLSTAGVWATVGDVVADGQGGGNFAGVFMDDIGCWTCVEPIPF